MLLRPRLGHAKAPGITDAAQGAVGMKDGDREGDSTSVDLNVERERVADDARAVKPNVTLPVPFHGRQD